MNKLTRKIVMLFVVLVYSSSLTAQSVQDKVRSAMAMDYRTGAELARDANRSPVEALAFMGLRDDMKVIEFLPAGQAWYSKILAPVLADRGQLYVIDSEQTFERWGDLWNHPAFKKVTRIPLDINYNMDERRYMLGELDINVTDADLFLNIREYHNFNLEDKTRLNTAAFNALKPGGHYVIIDHSLRHMHPKTMELARRADPVKTILEVQAAGFILEKSSDMFFRPDDKLDLEVGHDSVTGRTDRFFLVFKKP